MKIYQKHKYFTRRGSIAILATFLMGMAANVMAVKFFSDSHDQFAAARVSADGFRARQMALGGFQAGLAALKTVPEEYLYQTGITLQPPDIQVSPDEDPVTGKCRPQCFISYRIIPEDGKLNVNNLVLTSEDRPNAQYRQIFERFFVYYDVPVEVIDPIIDWIDENTFVEGTGAESPYYDSLQPPRKIKNYRMFNLSEITSVKDIEYNMIFRSRAPEDWFEIQEELKFQTEDEKLLIQADDWIPANNLTAYIPYGERFEDKININAARYHALMSLSDSMTREAVLALFKLRRKSGNYIKDVGALKDLPEFQVQTPLDVTLYEELAGTGGQVSGIIKTEGDIWRIVGVGSILPTSDNEEDAGGVVRKVTALYDKTNSRLIYYSED